MLYLGQHAVADIAVDWLPFPKRVSNLPTLANSLYLEQKPVSLGHCMQYFTTVYLKLSCFRTNFCFP